MNLIKQYYFRPQKVLTNSLEFSLVIPLVVGNQGYTRYHCGAIWSWGGTAIPNGSIPPHLLKFLPPSPKAAALSEDGTLLAAAGWSTEASKYWDDDNDSDDKEIMI